MSESQRKSPNMVCAKCGTPFRASPSHISNGVKMCSAACRSSVTPEERFWEKVNKNGPIPKHVPKLGPCWVWTAHTFTSGRPGFTFRGKHYMSSRVSWIISFGEIPEGQNVLHKCDNEMCVRPDHFFLGTASDNIKDMVSKGRQRGAVGLNNWNAILDPEKVIQIREMSKQGVKNPEIALEFDVSASNIGLITRGRTWRHV